MSHIEHGLLVFSAVTAALGIWLYGLSRLAPLVDSYWQRLPPSVCNAVWKAVESLSLTAQSVFIMAYGFWTTSPPHVADQSFGGFLNFCQLNWWSIVGGSILGPAYRARQGYKDAGGKGLL
jgi:hypothetical protein